MLLRSAALVLLCALAFALGSDGAHAQSSDPPPEPTIPPDGLVLVAVDGVERVYDSMLSIEGLALGATDTRNYELTTPDGAVAASCERYALLMMSRPGRYEIHLKKVGYYENQRGCVLRAAQ